MEHLNIFKKAGHPLKLFNEKMVDIKDRFCVLKSFIIDYLLKKNSRFKQHGAFLPKSKFQNWLPFVYFSKIETRKKKYEMNKKTKELYLSIKGIKKCMHYGKIYSKKNIEIQKNFNFLINHNFPIFRLISKLPGSRNLFCFQTGESGFFSSKFPNKIVLTDLKKNKITHIINSNLNYIDILSSHPNFSLGLLASNRKCSEFWRISPFNIKISMNLIYHKDSINFQNYRKLEKFIDFGTMSNKWKCFDEISQKYIFSHQFNEQIIEISTSKDTRLSTIWTTNHIHVFDNRITKKILDFKINKTHYKWLEWAGEKSKIIFSGKENIILNDMNKMNLENEKFNSNHKKLLKLNGNSKIMFFKWPKKTVNVSDILSKSSLQIIDSRKKIISLINNKTGSLLAIFNNNNVNIFHSR